MVLCLMLVHLPTLPLPCEMLWLLFLRLSSKYTSAIYTAVNHSAIILFCLRPAWEVLLDWDWKDTGLQ